MNREQRRAYNKQHKTKYTREDFDTALALARITNGQFDFNDVARAHNFVHIDNTELAPDGTVVKINYEDVYKRPQEDLTDEFKEFVEANKDTEFHLTRESAKDSLVCLEEDVRYAEIDGKQVVKPKFLFDLYSDLLIKTEDGFKPPYEVDEDMKNYVLAPAVKAHEETVKDKEN